MKVINNLKHNNKEGKAHQRRIYLMRIHKSLQLANHQKEQGVGKRLMIPTYPENLTKSLQEAEVKA